MSEPGAPPPPAHRTVPGRSGARGQLLGLLMVTHPLPSALYVVAVGIFAVLAAASAHRALAPGTLVRVLVAVGCAQIAIGALNDYRDRALDAASKPTKPLARGLIAPWEALALALGATGLLLALAPPLGLAPFVLLALIEGLGLAYDLWFKGTPVSALLYAIYFPLIPLLAWAVFGRWQPFLPWLLPLGAVLGVAMNVANSLPDLEDDLAAGVRGLPHLLGMRRGLLVVWIAPPAVLALLWGLDLAGVVPARLVGLLLATLAVVASELATLARYRRAPSPRTLRGNFFIQAFAVVALAAAWLAAVAL
ncbi:MAG: UbiA family prenyltransferase [Ktedonobacterales bacterium]|nr:UbiA family prenyltransferase [Ktedonobacterales bacterium]